jgi:glucose-6-phosphate-specific signal transduction histidine kinase
VQLACSPTELAISVSNSLDASVPPAGSEVAGTGLAGMAERAEILGGTFETRQTADRFIVQAVLPTAPAPGPTTKPNGETRKATP